MGVRGAINWKGTLRVLSLLAVCCFVILWLCFGGRVGGGWLHDAMHGDDPPDYSQYEPVWVETKVESSAFSKLAYEYRSHTARVYFRNGYVYDYSGVPDEVYTAWLKAPSMGKYYHWKIKGKYDYELIRKPGRVTSDSPDAKWLGCSSFDN